MRAFFTTRHGGISRPPYDSFNLGRNSGDDPDAVAHNRSLLASLAGAPVVFMSQVHGASVELVSSSTAEPEADALVTANPTIALGVLVADCVPVLLHDRGSGAVGAVHAGRMGVALGIVPRTVERMRDIGGTLSADIEAAIGPSICGHCYGVPEELRTQVAARVPDTWAETRQGTPSLDLRAGVEAQLKSVGVTLLGRVGECSFEDQSLFSHRRDGVTGRMAGVIVCGS